MNLNAYKEGIDGLFFPRYHQHFIAYIMWYQYRMLEYTAASKKVTWIDNINPYLRKWDLDLLFSWDTFDFPTNVFLMWRGFKDKFSLKINEERPWKLISLSSLIMNCVWKGFTAAIRVKWNWMYISCFFRSSSNIC